MTPEEILRAAVAAVEAAEVPHDLRAPAFDAAVRLVAGEPPELVSAPPSRDLAGQSASRPKRNRADTESSGTSPAAIGTDSTAFLNAFTHESGLDRNLLEELYYVHDGRVQLNVTQRQLGTTKAEQTKRVCLLMAAGYHFGLDTEDVPVADIQAECKRLKCYDRANFASHARKAAGVTMVGPPKTRRLKLRQADLATLEHLVDALTGNGEAEQES